MKRILVCGSNGLLGQKLAWLFDRESDYEVLHTSHHRSFVHEQVLVDYTQLDITNRGDVKSLISSYRPDVILNAAAMTNVDACEREKEQAWKANVTAVENLSEVCRRIDAKLVHISTDYVFDGKTGHYKENDRVNPINYYGKTKLAGENVIISSGIDHAILRTIVVYGVGVNVKNNFALWVINSLNEKKQIRCVDDQISNPTNVFDLAMAMKRIVEQDISGVYHVCGAETISRYDFAVRAAEVFGYDPSLIQRIKTTELRQDAQRPLNTSFIFEKAKQAFHYQPMNATQGLTMLQQELTGIHLN
ncbi:MAG: dTDP-4-dehydrorhamnose reductase [Ignavibacteriales bacterium]|nr:dTDP-4-dehydrorhamnose reductase [Ignavibacteriales bacterium]